jgi:hypothetical protein
MAIPITSFGRDHWSTFAYVEVCALINEGRLEPRRMRCDEFRHPQFAHIKGSTPPTRIREGKTTPNHDDWDCLDDCEVAGLIKNVGTGLNRVYELTDLGQQVAAELRIHKQKGGNFASFRE